MTESNPGLARRKKLQEERTTRLVPRNTVKVFAATEELRRILKHPNGTGFRARIDQGVDWPNDSFTHRRMADGAVLVEGQTAPRRDPLADEKLGVRARMAARRPQQQDAPSPPEAPKQRSTPTGK